MYRARDNKLHRDVALKVLPQHVGSVDRLARFEREARALAALNHPNIATIHRFEDSGDTHALVMELVEGPTLADRISEGPLPAAEALGIAAQLADALESAHEQGIVHRDLKPSNVKLCPDGSRSRNRRGRPARFWRVHRTVRFCAGFGTAAHSQCGRLVYRRRRRHGGCRLPRPGRGADAGAG